MSTTEPAPKLIKLQDYPGNLPNAPGSKCLYIQEVLATCGYSESNHAGAIQCFARGLTKEQAINVLGITK